MKPLATTVLSVVLLASACAKAGPPGNAGEEARPTTTLQGSQTFSVTRNGSQSSWTGPAEHFAGSVRVDPLFQANPPSHTSGAYVTFEPGAHTAWHTHPLGQTLVVTAGVGRVELCGAGQSKRSGRETWSGLHPVRSIGTELRRTPR